MMSDFRRIFNPTVEEQIQDIDSFLNIHKELIGHCCTCRYYRGSTMPGFVTDCGECLLASPLFSRKVFTPEKWYCPSYLEDKVIIEELKTIREKLSKGEER